MHARNAGGHTAGKQQPSSLLYSWGEDDEHGGGAYRARGASTVRGAWLLGWCESLCCDTAATVGLTQCPEFYGDEDEGLFDWYSACEFLQDAVEREAEAVYGQDAKRQLVLDVGCGTCPLLFELQRQGYSNLHGVDFSSSAIGVAERFREEGGIPAADMRFDVADAVDMATVESGSCAFVVDKGCLDCFVNSKSPGALSRVQQYVAEVARVLAPGGRYLLLPTNASDIPTFLATGSVVLDKASTSAKGAHAQGAEWEAAKREVEAARAAWARRFVVEEIRARENKHLFVCRLCSAEEAATLPESPAHMLCDLCGSQYPYPAYPSQCSSCIAPLDRFCLS